MSIYRDKRTGRWRFDFDHWIAGQRHRRRQLLPAGWTRAQAEAHDRKESGALFALAKGIERPRWTIAQAVARYTRERAPQLKHGPNVARELSAMLDWYDGRALEDLPDVCREYATDQAGALAPATVKNRISYLRAACRYAWKRHNMGESDPGARVMVPTVRNARETTIDRRQMLQLARACPEPGTRAAIRVAFYTGMRVGEQYAAERLPGMFVLRDTKNREPRLIPINPKIATAARVPLPKLGKLHYWWEKTRALCGLSHVRLHDIRHSTASALVAAGEDLATIGAVLGHKSPASTKRYSHWRTDRLAAALGKIGRKSA